MGGAREDCPSVGAKATAETKPRPVATGDRASAELAGVDGEAAALSSARISGCSKSHATPCLTQLPHLGWTSSHWGDGGHVSVSDVSRCAAAWDAEGKTRSGGEGGVEKRQNHWRREREAYLDLACLAAPAAGPRFLVGATRRHGPGSGRCPLTAMALGQRIGGLQLRLKCAAT